MLCCLAVQSVSAAGRHRWDAQDREVLTMVGWFSLQSVGGQELGAVPACCLPATCCLLVLLHMLLLRLRLPAGRASECLCPSGDVMQ
jgi:hypothetical protein